MGSEATQFAPQTGKHYSNGLPKDELDRLTDAGVQQVSLGIQRRNARGHLLTITGSFIRTIDELYDVENYVGGLLGGGQYRITVRDVASIRNTFFSFEMILEGAPKLIGAPPSTLPQTVTAGTQPVDIHTTGFDTDSAWFKSLRPEERAALLRGAPPAMFASDQVLAEQVRARDEELAKIREAREKEAVETKARLEKMEAQLAEERERAREAQANARVAALEAKLQALAEARAQPTAPQPTLLEQMTAAAPMIAAAAPILQSWFSSRASESEKALTTQQQVLNTVLAQSLAPRPDSTKELLMAVGPMLTPLLAKALDGKGPEQQAALFQAMTESQLQTVSMMSQLLEGMAPPPESPVGMAVRTALEGLQRVAMMYASTRGGLPGQLPAPPSPVGNLHAHGPSAPAYDRGGPDEQVVDSPNADAAMPAPRRRAQPRPPGPELQALFGLLPSDFQTPAWRTILEQLHTEPPPPAESVATLIAGHVEDLMQLGQLPAALSQLTEHPRETLEAMLEVLPVAGKNPGYVRSVLDLVLEYLASDGFIPVPQTQEPAEGEVEGEGEEPVAEAAES